MTLSQYAKKLVELIEARPRDIELDKLLYEIYVQSKIAEARRDQKQGRWDSNTKVMEEMWEMLDSKSGGPNARK